MGLNLGKAALAVGTGGLSLLAGGGGGGTSAAPTIDPRVQQNAYLMADTGKGVLDWNKTALDKMTPTFDSAVANANTIAGTALDRATTAGNIYDQSFAPVTQQVATDAMNWDTGTALDKAAAQAGATVDAKYAQADNRRGAMMAKYGLNPADALRLGEMANLQHASDSAVAENAGRDARRTQGVQMRTNAAGVGANVLSGATALDSLALQGGNSAAGLEGERVNTYNAGTQGALPWLTGSNNALTGVNNSQMQAWQTNEQMKAAKAAGIGKLVGTVAGAGLGFMAGGPAGGAAGSNIGGAAGSAIGPNGFS